MTMITPSYLGETIEYSSLHACRSTLEDPTVDTTQRLPRDDVGKRSGSGQQTSSEPLATIGQATNALQHAVLVQDSAEGRSAARTDAFLYARLLLHGHSLVAPVKQLYDAVRIATGECGAHLERFAGEGRALLQRFQQQTGLQKQKVASLRRVLQQLNDESEASFRHELSQSRLEVQRTVLSRINRLQPELEKQMLILDQLQSTTGTLLKLARNCATAMPLQTFDRLLLEEARAAKTICRFAACQAFRLDRLRSQASKGESARVQEMLSECLTDLSRSCIFRDRVFTKAATRFGHTLRSVTRNIATLLDVIGQYCAVTGHGEFMRFKVRLQQLDLLSRLPTYFSLRAAMALAVHLFWRASDLNTWSVNKNTP